MAVCVAPVRERGLKYDYHEDFVLMYLVAPVRERGLKFLQIEEVTSK